jgi:predicted metalloendopeptidase
MYRSKAMTQTYELWDTESRNMVAEFASRAEALIALYDALQAHGGQALEMLALSTEDGDGGGEVVARGAGLVALIEQEGTKSPPSAASAH